VKEQGLEGSFWPSERQKLLLRTAFAGGEASAAAWRSLRPRPDLDRLELGSFPLLPLVQRQLERLGVEDPYMPRLAGIRRRTWYLNQLQLDALAPALRVLVDAGAEPVVVGGWQYPAHYYDGDFGLRPVEGLEVLVRQGRTDVCAHTLEAHGFVSSPGAAGGAACLVGPNGHTCTLQDRVAREFSVPERGIDFEDPWDETIEISLGETRTRVLAPSDELVRLCLAGARATVPPNVLWLADALAVLQASGDALDWERVARHALRLRAMLRLRDALVYLRRELDAAVPEAVVSELEATPPRPRELLAHKKAGRSRWPSTATRFLHVTSDRPLPAALVELPAFLRDELGLKRRGQVPLEVARRAATRIRTLPKARAGRPTVEAK
jgi:putative nucleotidyltransferase-like protein